MREQLERSHLSYISLNYDSLAGNNPQILPAAPQDTLLEDMRTYTTTSSAARQQWGLISAINLSTELALGTLQREFN